MINVSQKSWFSLSLEINDSVNLDLINFKFYNYLIGSTEINGKYIFYFESINKKFVNKILDLELKEYNFEIENFINKFFIY